MTAHYTLSPAATFPCTEKVENARCLDGSGCRPGFPGESCYTVREVWGTVGCIHDPGYPPCGGVKPVHHCSVRCSYINKDGFRMPCGQATARGTSSTSTLCAQAKSLATKACGGKKKGQRCGVSSSS